MAKTLKEFFWMLFQKELKEVQRPEGIPERVSGHGLRKTDVRDKAGGGSRGIPLCRGDDGHPEESGGAQGEQDLSEKAGHSHSTIAHPPRGKTSVENRGEPLKSALSEGKCRAARSMLECQQCMPWI
jgi:hypothetical protein